MVWPKKAFIFQLYSHFCYFKDSSFNHEKEAANLRDKFLKNPNKKTNEMVPSFRQSSFVSLKLYFLLKIEI